MMVHAISSVYFATDLIIFASCCLVQFLLIILWLYHLYFVPSTLSLSIPNIIAAKTESKVQIDRDAPHLAVAMPNISNNPSLESAKSKSKSIDKLSDDGKHEHSNNKRKSRKSIMFGIEMEMFKQIGSIPSYIKICSTLSIAAGLIYEIMFVSFYCFQYSSNKISCSLKNIGILPIMLNRGFLYLYFIARLELSFEETQFTVSNRILIALKMYLIIGFLCGIIFYYYFATINQCTVNSIFWGILPSAFLDGSTSITCLILIIYKLKQLLKHTENMTNIQDLKYIMSKLCILTIVAICSTAFGTLIYNVLPLVGFAGIDMLFNTICLMLSFAHYDIFYQKMCAICRKCCEYT